MKNVNMKKFKNIPEERSLTIRQEVLKNLEFNEMSVNELSKSISKSEKELYDHLGHLLRAKAIVMIDAKCLKCGFTFKKRRKVKKPGKCPECKNSYINAPLFTTAKL